jgi:hypothetical protein
MKNTRACPKCRSTEIVRVPGPDVAGGFYIGPGGLGIPVTQFICVNCGYCERWVEAAFDLKALKREFGPSRPSPAAGNDT